MIDKNTINILRLKLQMSLAANDIDAWSDLLADATRINAAASGGTPLRGKLTGLKISQLVSGSELAFGQTGTYQLIGQTFVSSGSITACTIKVKFRKQGNPSDNATMRIYGVSGNVPTGVLYTATNSFAGASVSISLTDYTFSFSGMSLAAGQYAFVLGRSGANNDDHYFIPASSASNSYSDGSWARFNGSTWTADSSLRDLYF